MRIRTPRASAAALLLPVLVAACGGGDAAAPAETTARTPRLAAPVAEQLAARSDAIAARLAAGDVCGAAHEADALRAATVEAINAGRIPAAYQEDLGARVNELVDAVNCPPPPAPATTAAAPPESAAKPGKGKAKGHDKQKKGKHGRREDEG
jgi:hypothetical protein